MERQFRVSGTIATFGGMIAFLLAWPTTAFALQTHAGPEGLYAHQGAHLFLFVALVIFLANIRRYSLGAEKAWRLLFWGTLLLALWKQISPISGSINTITFVMIGSVTLYFRRMETIIKSMARDRDRISGFSRELLELNRDIETIVSDRTRMEMALRFAHDVRNPAMIIGGLARRLSKNIQDDSPEKVRIRQIQEQAENLEALVGRIDLPGKRSSWKFSSLDLNVLAEEAVAVVQDEADRKGIVMFLDRAPSPLIFQGSRHLVKIALMHTLRNSIEACAAGDTIQIITEAGERSVLVQIEDDGPGIPREMAAHIFEPFFSTGEGTTGIGLPYVKQIVEDHRGTITLASSKEGGTSVVINFPPLLGELSRTLKAQQVAG